VYLEPWHSDIFEWLDLRKNHGKEEVGTEALSVCIPAFVQSRVETPPQDVTWQQAVYNCHGSHSWAGRCRARNVFYGVWWSDLVDAEWFLSYLSKSQRCQTPRNLLTTESCTVLQVRARDLFYGLWVNDLFMRRVEANAEWSLFCPNEAPGLAECWGEAFDALYQKFEREGRAKRTIKAQQLWFAILEAQVSTHCFCGFWSLPVVLYMGGILLID